MDRQIKIGLIVLLAVLLISGGCIQKDEAPKTPTGFSIVREEYDPVNQKYGDKLFLSWNANTEPDLKGYKVYRSYKSLGKVEHPKTEYTLVATISENSYVDTDLQVGDEATIIFYYKISAFDNTGHESPLSEEVEIEYTPYG